MCGLTASQSFLRKYKFLKFNLLLLPENLNQQLTLLVTRYTSANQNVSQKLFDAVATSIVSISTPLFRLRKLRSLSPDKNPTRKFFKV